MKSSPGMQDVDIIRGFFENWSKQINSNLSGAGHRNTKVEVYATDNRIELLGPVYIFTTETGRGPRKSSKPFYFLANLYEYMQKRNMFHSKTEDGKISEARGLRWYINKYGTELYKKGGRKDIFSNVLTESEINKMVKAVSDNIFLNINTDGT